MRVLVLAPRFAPAPTVAAVRWTALADALADEGATVGVICQRRRGDGDDDRVLLALRRRRAAGGDRGGETGGAPTAEGAGAGGAGRRAGLVRTLNRLAVPDTAAIAWFRRRREILAAARAFAPDVVVSTSPPHGLHLVGRWLAGRLGRPWVLDLRDPYVGDARYDPVPWGPWRWANRALERRLVGAADVVMTAGAAHADDLRRRHPAAAAAVVHLPNGFHPSDRPAPAPTASASVELGVVATAAPAELRTVVAGAAAAWPGRTVRLHAVGLPEAQVAGLRPLVEVVAHPWTPAADLPALLADASILLLVLSSRRGGAGGTSTKLYQYIDAGRPILAVNPYPADLPLLERWARFVALRDPDEAAVAAALQALVAGAGDGDGPAGIDGRDRAAAFREEHSWSAIGARLGAVLTSLRP